MLQLQAAIGGRLRQPTCWPKCAWDSDTPFATYSKGDTKLMAVTLSDL